MVQTVITCEALISFLDAFLDSRLEQAEQERFTHHLARCESCVAYLESYRETIRLAKGASLEPHIDLESVPEELVRAILDSAR